MASTITVGTETLRVLAEGSILNTYVSVGPRLAHPARMISFINNTNGDMFFSDDGVNDKYFVPQSSFRIYDFCTNRLYPDKGFLYPQGTQFFVRYSSSPSSGSVYIESIFGVNANTGAA